MKIAIEIPTRYLSEWSKLCDFDFVIASQAVADREYFRYYKARERFDGRILVLDNGVYEGNLVSTTTLLGTARLLEADVVVAPDVLGDVSETIKNLKSFRPLVPADMLVMGVVQGRTTDDWLKAYSAISVEADWIGIPLVPFGRGWQEREYNRLSFLVELERLGMLVDKPHHLLGLASLKELLGCPSYICSVDTSLPVLYGMSGWRLDSYHERPDRPPDYFEANLSADATRCTLQNILLIKEAVLGMSRV